MIFWHESSATEPGGTARNDRAPEPGAANIPAMPVAGAAPLVSVPQAGRGQCGGSCDYGADRSALSGPALLGVTTRTCFECTTSWTKHERAARWYVRCTL